MQKMRVMLRKNYTIYKYGVPGFVPNLQNRVEKAQDIRGHLDVDLEVDQEEDIDLAQDLQEEEDHEVDQEEAEDEIVDDVLEVVALEVDGQEVDEVDHDRKSDQEVGRLRNEERKKKVEVDQDDEDPDLDQIVAAHDLRKNNCTCVYLLNHFL